MLTVSLTTPDEAVLITQSQRALTGANTFVISTAEDYALAAQQLGSIKGRTKELDEMRKSIVRPLDEAREKIQELFRRPLIMLMEAESILKQMMLVWQNEQRRVQLEKQQAIDDAARKERARLAEEAAKVAAKAREQAEEARRKAQLAEEARQRAVAEGNAKAAAAAAQRNAKLAEQAASIELAGKEKAAELQTISDLVVAPTVATVVPTVKGQFTRTRWCAKVVDHEALLKDIANNKPHYGNVLPPDLAVLNKLASATEGRLKLDGVECFEVDTLISRAAR